MKQKKNMGLWQIVLGLAFLCNPVVALIDGLPDCVGLLLILIGLNKLSDLSAHLSEAADGLQKMLRVSLLEPVAAYLVYDILADLEGQLHARETPSLILAVSFASLFFKCWFLMPALKKLFHGLSRLSDANGGELGETGGLSSFTSFFIVFSGAMAMLPYCSVLTSNYGDKSFAFDWYPFLGLFNTICGLLSGIFGLIWLIFILRMGRRLLRKESFLVSLEALYEREVGGETGMLLVRRCRLSLRMMLWGALFLLNLRLSYRTVLPGIAGAGLILCAVWLLGDVLPNKRRLSISAVVLAAISLCQLFFSNRYLKTFIPPDAAHLPRAFNQYLPVQLLRTLEAVAFFALLFLLFRALRRILYDHTGIEYEQGEGAELLTNRARTRLHKTLCRRLNGILILLGLSLALSAADAWIGVYLAPFWWFSVLVGAVGLLLFAGFLNDLCDEIGYRYHSDGMNKRLG